MSTRQTLRQPGTTDAPATPNPVRWRALSLLLGATAMDLVAATVVSLALPTIGDAFDAGASSLEWVITAYALAFACGLVTGGRLGDVYGRRRIFTLGVAGFTAAATICAFAPAMPILLAARAMQGLFAALMIPQVLSVITDVFPAAERPRAFGWFGATAAVATVVGPLLGGLLVVLGPYGWRLIFLVNLPLGIAILFLVRRLVPESRAQSRVSLDVLGAVLLTAGLLLALFPLVEAPQHGWNGWSTACLAAALLALATFGIQQRHKERHGTAALLPPRLFRRRSFIAGTVAASAFFSGPPALLFLTSITVQGIGHDALYSSLIFAPLALASAPTAIRSAAWLRRYGRAVPLLGVLLVLLGESMLILTTAVGAGSINPLLLIPGFILTGLGLGLVSPVLIDLVLADVDPNDAGAASGTLNTAMQAGGAMGIALAGLLFHTGLPDGADPASAVDISTAFAHGLGYTLVATTATGIALALIPRTPVPPTRTQATVSQHNKEK